ncbi:diacylglycerol kinase 7-like [Dioscorea cayenensis subsp. rotundata]|uniref:Diacylglycerol kinase n=1 Tax=Dioscorea cayennensis subsp. rotundata TaxID=55577 RepID=A0AB40D176_DIOCR|nr:diacylglycerol kinase 7-like [Dioscorea cayenensis subsp. rotundata]
MSIDKEELRRKLLMPEYIREAMVKSMKRGFEADKAKDNVVSDDSALKWEEEVVANALAKKGNGVVVPEVPLVVFVSPKSGGGHGTKLKDRLEDLMAKEQVFDLDDKEKRPAEFVKYGLVCLERLAELGDSCARLVRQRLRVMVAGGDGSVGWVLGSLAELIKQKREPVPPVGIIPLGTGNDLSRSFGWGGSFPFAWRSAVKRSLHRAINNPTRHLDSWQIVLKMPASAGDIVPPYSLRPVDKCDFSQGLDIDKKALENLACFEGCFYNYFSIGMDAQVAYGFHQLREKKPKLAKGPITNKLIYSGYSCSQGWFCTPCLGAPCLRELKNIMELYIKRPNHTDWEPISVPPDVRSIVALNLHNYGGGRNPWGHPTNEYLHERGFLEAHEDDGLLEIFGLKQGWHASFVMVELITAKHIAQAAAIKLEIKGNQCQKTFMQTDGEPWKQPLDEKSSTFVMINRMPFQHLMISGM